MFSSDLCSITLIRKKKGGKNLPPNVFLRKNSTLQAISVCPFSSEVFNCSLCECYVSSLLGKIRNSMKWNSEIEDRDDIKKQQ